MIKKFFILVILLTIFTNSVYALTADSDSYSVSRFGTGVQATGLSSDNLEARSVLLASAGTRNAENDPLTTNIGFFENTTYYVTVSITSYSISPSSAAVGSTVALSISALNAQFVWAEITSPNGQEQNLTLTNGQSTNYLPSPSVVGRYNVTFYANSSSGSIASAVDHFDLTEASPTQSHGGGDSDSSIVDVQVSTTVSNQQAINGIIAQFEKNEKIIIDLKLSNSTNIESHAITMSDIETNSVTIVISSNPITFNLTTGEEKEINIDGDWKKDVYFKLKEINNGKADLIIRQITVQHPSITGELIKRPENLMDISTRILDDYKIITPGNKVLVEITLYNFGTEEIKDVKLKYCIETSNRTTVKCLKETLAVYTKLQLVKEFLISQNTKPGGYLIKTEAVYGNEKVQAETTFEIREDNFIKNNFIIRYLLPIGLGILILLTVLIFIYKEFMHKEKKQRAKLKVIPLKSKLMQLDELRKSGSISKKEYVHERKILLSRFVEFIKKNKVFASLIFAGIIVAFLTIITKTNITGLVINNVLSYSNGSLLILLVLLSIFGLLIALRKNIFPTYNKVVEFLSRTKDNSDNYPKDSVKGLINKKVYSEEGNYLGKINDIILGIGRIDSLMIKMDKKYKLKAKGIVVNYKQVKSVGEVIIIDEKVSELIKGQED
ncbi:MAG: PRC-barrel domain-containing protein [Nanoarchaeota archaeon]